MILRVKKLHDIHATIPAYKTPSSAGLDLYLSCALRIPSKELCVGETSVSVELPSGHFGLIRPRSSIASKCKLLFLSSGIIDQDYRGEVTLPFFNLGDEEVHLGYKERVAQLIVLPYTVVDPVEVEKLTDTVRGSGGYGSTGKY